MAPEISERVIATNGVRLRTLDCGEPGDPVVVLAHGFPELAFSWRHQIPVLAAGGYRVLAPDQRGYGGSSRPAAIDAYSIDHLTADLVGLLDDVGAEQAVFVGHDWGSIVTWALPLLHPRRVAGVAGLSGPPVPRSRRPPTKIWREAVGDNFFYILYFQEPGIADLDLGRDPATTIRRIIAAPRVDRQQLADMQRPGPQSYVDRLPEPAELPHWLKRHELDYYISEFSRTGFTGALNWYRNFDRNWELTAAPPASTITVPALFIAGGDDPVLSFTRTDRHGEVVTGPYREIIIAGAGHWIQQERPDEVNAALLDLLSTAF
ncbi:alpha/beta fold hydrolase [Mycolicibacterium litorale]|uniref:Epoxide hydrolase A n=1 Tax=Mycolicibacterium litorale TaxID=758802 RepID=A0AAD1IML4_9MYCO|nr:alpha/beta hydrolase [Mycolicibacterium litorale]MCV7417421.1 alpha/beta hydrolase [Mycolicibacterium litorale]TDY05211.1 pimeloyl-ACP methyl ester carboxylesterase [Mycolicibacterium litorale]BBY18647.1 epoxide hydrolase A [Mycolicibacterium litorale]